MTPDGAVHLHRAGAVARITFDRPAARNAMTMAMYDALEGHLEALARELGRGGGGARAGGAGAPADREAAPPERRESAPPGDRDVIHRRDRPGQDVAPPAHRHAAPPGDRDVIHRRDRPVQDVAPPADRHAVTPGDLDAPLPRDRDAPPPGGPHAADPGEPDALPPGGPHAPPLRVVVLRGAAGAFVAGTDIAHFSGFRGGEDGVRYERRLEEVVGALEALPLPTVAVVEGAAMGGGLILAAACDLRVCTPDARFGAPIARTVGNCLSVANIARLVAHLGPSRTRALLLLAGTLDAEEARGCGFVQEVVEPGALDERVEELCARLASLAPLTLRATKEAVRRVTAAHAADGDDLVRQVYGSADFRRGVEAFLAKERPEWEGR